MTAVNNAAMVPASVQPVVTGLHNARYIDVQIQMNGLCCMLYNGHYVKRRWNEGSDACGGKVKMADAKRKREFERTRAALTEMELRVPALEEMSWRSKHVVESSEQCAHGVSKCCRLGIRQAMVAHVAKSRGVIGTVIGGDTSKGYGLNEGCGWSVRSWLPRVVALAK